MPFARAVSYTHAPFARRVQYRGSHRGLGREGNHWRLGVNDRGVTHASDTGSILITELSSLTNTFLTTKRIVLHLPESFSTVPWTLCERQRLKIHTYQPLNNGNLDDTLDFSGFSVLSGSIASIVLSQKKNNYTHLYSESSYLDASTSITKYWAVDGNRWRWSSIC